MKNKIFLVVLTLFSLLSCSKDAPEPTSEVLDKGHEQWYTMDFIITQGSLHTGADPYFEQVTQQTTQGEYPVSQKYSLTFDGKNVVASQTKPILLEEGKAYSMEFFYYNRKGELMNEEYIEPLMAPIHQHFFVPKNITKVKGGEQATKENLISYVYRDTEPYDKYYGEPNVKLRDAKDPIGLKGYFTVNKAYQKFFLNVVLAHIIKGTKLYDNGTPRPFNDESLRGDMRATTDLETQIPMYVFTDGNSANCASDLAQALGITESKANTIIQERNKILEGTEKIKF